MKGNFYVVFAPSGAGKTAIVNSLTTNRGITTTSRVPRKGEVHGVDYYFISKTKFEELIHQGMFIEWAVYERGGNKEYYGLTKEEFHKRLEQGDLFVICTIDGVRHYKSVYPNTIAVYIDSSFEDVKKQLHTRGSKAEEIEGALNLYSKEAKTKGIADYIIKNCYGELNKAIEQFKEIIEKNKN